MSEANLPQLSRGKNRQKLESGIENGVEMTITEDQKRLKKIDKWRDKFLDATIGEIFNGKRNNTEFGIASNYQKLVRVASADKYGMCECISCGRRKSWKEMNGGHYESRANKATIVPMPLNDFYDGMAPNVNPQCVFCNKYRSGARVEYRQALVERHGEDAVVKLERFRMPEDYTWNRYELAQTKVEIMEEINFHENRLFLMLSNLRKDS